MESKPVRLVKTELIISSILRYGVAVCIVIIGIGLFGRLLNLNLTSSDSSLKLIHQLTHGQLLLGYHPIHIPSELFDGIMHFNPDVIAISGLILLIALPIIRVGMTVLLFIVERDWIFLVLTLIVFSILLFGIIFGHSL